MDKKYIIEIPEIAVVAMVGTSSSGKSTFAQRYFKPTEVLSSDYFRALISDDENSLEVNTQTFDTLYYVAHKRLDLGLVTVIDATNLQRDARTRVLQLAKEQNCHAVAIVLDIPEKVCQERNENRPNRQYRKQVIKTQHEQLRRSVRHLKREGFRFVYVLKEADIDTVEIVRKPLWNNKKEEAGPFDIIGDIHGCYDELCALLGQLGYTVDAEHGSVTAPPGRRVIFLGDLCDRGPMNVEVLRLVMGMVRDGSAYCTAGNHDAKLLKKLRGANVQLTHGLDITVQALQAQSDEFVNEVREFLDGLISHYIFDGGKLVVAHAGLVEKYQGRGSARVRDFCLYGDTTDETDEFGLPVRLPWANDYRGKAMVVFGHTPNPNVEIVNNTYNIDTGCVFGGKLTALRYPERDIVQVDAQGEYCAPVKPLLPAPAVDDGMIDASDVLGQRFITTRLQKNIKLREENTTAALEIMGRFAVDPRWLIYLPPTMSPCETSALPDYLEHPVEAFAYYRQRGVTRVVCQQKHMGSRAVMVLCRNAEAAARRFKVDDGTIGVIYTRTGRGFFDDAQTERAILSRLQTALTQSDFWGDFETDWVCLDVEIMPWSAKAQKLIESQYAPTSRAGRNGLAAAVEVLAKAEATRLAHQPAAQDDGSVDLSALHTVYMQRASALASYTEEYRRYCWDVASLDDYRIAPFHILATEGKVWNDENHTHHMDTIKKYMTMSDCIFMATEHVVVDITDETKQADAIQWWIQLTESGGEGMVVKPYDFIATKGREVLQPAVKCRGRGYLQIIYGPEYMLGDHLNRLKKRSLGRKRGLALSEFALGMEALERFVNNEPLFRVHECVFGVLALESEPVDPRL